MHIYDVVIVGAGPVGLATAIGLRERGIENVLVIDQTRAFRPVGQVLDILPNGLKALKLLSFPIYEGVKGINALPLQTQSTTGTKPIGEQPSATNTSKSKPIWVYRDVAGEPIRSVPLTDEYWVQQYGEGRISTSWFGLQTKLRECLPPDWVRINHRCVGLREDTSSSVIYLECTSNTKATANPYAHWEEQSQEQTPNTVAEPSTITIPARLVVAADGINSTIRRELYRDSPQSAYAQPHYSGFSAIYCTEIPDVPKALRTELNRLFFQDSPVVTVCGEEVCPEPIIEAAPRIMMFHRSTERWGYMIQLAIPCDHLHGMSGWTLIHEAQKLLLEAHFPKSIQQYVGLAPVEKIQQRPYYMHKVSNDSPWSVGRVTLVGDAAHGMPPFVAQGVNQGFEDAATIAQLIAELDLNANWDNAKPITEAFRKYEQLRRPIVNRVQDAVLAKTILWSEKEWQEYNQTVYGRDHHQAL